jgi:hypothetical protein
VTYGSGTLTRFIAYWYLGMLSMPTLAFAVMRWRASGQPRDGLAALWVIAVTASCVHLLGRLGRLERGRSEPDEAMNLVFRAAMMIPAIGFLPIIWWLSR